LPDTARRWAGALCLPTLDNNLPAFAAGVRRHTTPAPAPPTASMPNSMPHAARVPPRTLSSSPFPLPQLVPRVPTRSALGTTGSRMVADGYGRHSAADVQRRALPLVYSPLHPLAAYSLPLPCRPPYDDAVCYLRGRHGARTFLTTIPPFPTTTTTPSTGPSNAPACTQRVAERRRRCGWNGLPACPPYHVAIPAIFPPTLYPLPRHLLTLPVDVRQLRVRLHTAPTFALCDRASYTRAHRADRSPCRLLSTLQLLLRCRGMRCCLQQFRRQHVRASPVFHHSDACAAYFLAIFCLWFHVGSSRSRP